MHDDRPGYPGSAAVSEDILYITEEQVADAIELLLGTRRPSAQRVPVGA
jgi:hypothetical protein